MAPSVQKYMKDSLKEKPMPDTFHDFPKYPQFEKQRKGGFGSIGWGVLNPRL